MCVRGDGLMVCGDGGDEAKRNSLCALLRLMLEFFVGCARYGFASVTAEWFARATRAWLGMVDECFAGVKRASKSGEWLARFNVGR